MSNRALALSRALPLTVLLLGCAAGNTLGATDDAGADPTDLPRTDVPDVSVDTPSPSTDTPSLPTDTPSPSTDTPSPPTDIPSPPTDIPSPPTDIPTPPTDTPTPDAGVRCGGVDEACCGTACNGGAVCLAGRCAACGAEGQRCCAAGACVGGTACDGAFCRPCGRVGAACCPGELCTSGAVCASGRCGADADRDGVPAPLDCDDNDPLRSPNAAERCNNRDDNCDARVDEGDVCGLWFLPRGATAWQAFPRDPGREQVPARPSPHAPTLPVRAAIDIESLGLAYVLTDGTWHLLDLGTRAWVDSGPRAQLLPEALGASLITGYSVPASHVDPMGTYEGVSLIFRDRVLQYHFLLASRAMRFVRRDAVNEWTGPFAPSLSLARLVWLDIQNGDGWVTQSPASFCPPGTTTATRVGPYFAVVTDTTVHLGDAGYCFVWVNAVPTGSFAAFQRSGAPPLGAVGATWYRGGLWALRAE